MSSNLADMMKESRERNDIVLKAREKKAKLERQYEADVLELTYAHFFNLARLRVIYLIETGQDVEVDTRLLNELVSGKYFSRKSELQTVLGTHGVRFLEWLRENKLTYELVEDHDGCGVSSWVTMRINPIPDTPVHRNPAKSSGRRGSSTDAAYGGSRLYNTK